MTMIEAASRDDIPALVALLRALFSQELEFKPDCVRQTRGLDLILSKPELGRIFVARRDDEVVGMVSLLFTVSTALGAQVCWLEDMVVRQDARKCGLGSALIEHALTFADAHGYERISLLTDANNADAQRFYVRHGFARSQMMTLRRAKPVNVL